MSGIDRHAWSRMRLSEIWSGGQTGADRAALDAALEAGVPARGWIPRGRIAEDGIVPARYMQLTETESADDAERTERNVRDTDATLILHDGPPGGGTQLTHELALALGRPVLALDLGVLPIGDAARLALDWCRGLPGPIRLNVAGPRASTAPAIYPLARAVVTTLLRELATADASHHTVEES